MTPRRLCILPVRWPEIPAGDDLDQRIVETGGLCDGDIVVLTSKVVSKAAGRVVSGERTDWVTAEAAGVVARRGETVIARTRHGLVLAAAGVDASNTTAGTVVLLPEDADATARLLRRRIEELSGCNVAVVVTDTAGRAWRLGQTDIAIGCAGLEPLADLRGSADSFGRRLDVTMPATADEIAAASDLVTGKVTGCPLAVVRGLSSAVLPRGHAGPGAVALVRDPDADLFGLGAREAALAASLRRDDDALGAFPALGPDEEVPFGAVAAGASAGVSFAVQHSGTDRQRTWVVQVGVRWPGETADWFDAGQLVERARVLATAHRLVETPTTGAAEARPGWRTAACMTWRIA